MNAPAPGSFWLIAKVEAGRVRVLTTDLARGETALPVFGFEDEARMFRRLAVPYDGWRVRETTVGELVSLLLGLCSGVSRVLLDPLPALTGRLPVNPFGMRRQPFVEFLLRRSATAALRREDRRLRETTRRNGGLLAAPGPTDGERSTGTTDGTQVTAFAAAKAAVGRPVHIR
jgi:hypothetical protein